jgi:hypothetical protein
LGFDNGGVLRRRSLVVVVVVVVVHCRRNVLGPRVLLYLLGPVSPISLATEFEYIKKDSKYSLYKIYTVP